MPRLRGVSRWLPGGDAARPLHGASFIVPLRQRYHGRAAQSSASASTSGSGSGGSSGSGRVCRSLPLRALCYATAAAATVTASAAASAACSARTPSSEDDREGGSSARFFMEPINALRKAAAVLLYTTPDTPPVIHTPHAPDGPLPRLQYPVVLVHGFLGYSSLLTNPINQQPVFEYFGELRSLLEGAGHTVIVPVLPRSYKVERRAKALQVALGLTAVSAELVAETADGGRQTQKQTPVADSDKRDVQRAKHDERSVPAAASTGSEEEGVTVLTNNRIDLAAYKGPFHLIAHSMGGLDARFLITHLQPEGDNRILSLTTIGSPHHGSPIADIIVEQVQRERTLPIPAPTLSATAADNQTHRDSPTELPTFKIEQVVAFISNTFGLDFRGMLDLSTSACADFNSSTPNRSDTHYRSYSGYRRFNAWSVWYLPGKIIEAREGFNDGLVSVSSAQWGEHVGTVPLDHLQQVGLGVMHRHIDLYKEIVWELHRVEQRDGDEQRRRERDRAHGRRATGSAAEQQQHEHEASQRTEQSRERAQQKGRQDAQQTQARDNK